MNIKELLEKYTDKEMGFSLHDKMLLIDYTDYLIEDLRGKLSNQKIDNGHDCYDHLCKYCENYLKDDLIYDQITTLLSIKKEIEES